MRYQPKENRCDTSVSLIKEDESKENRVLVPLVEYSPFTSYYPTLGVAPNIWVTRPKAHHTEWAWILCFTRRHSEVLAVGKHSTDCHSQVLYRKVTVIQCYASTNDASNDTKEEFYEELQILVNRQIDKDITYIHTYIHTLTHAHTHIHIHTYNRYQMLQQHYDDEDIQFE